MDELSQFCDPHRTSGQFDKGCCTGEPWVNRRTGVESDCRQGNLSRETCVCRRGSYAPGGAGELGEWRQHLSEQSLAASLEGLEELY